MKTVNNPAVERLFARVTNPFLRAAVTRAVAGGKPIAAERAPVAALEPLFILSAAAREFKAAPIVEDIVALRKRLAAAELNLCLLTKELLRGATFSTRPVVYPPAARQNCLPEEVQLGYLPVGSRFRQTDYKELGPGKWVLGKTTCVGTLIDLTPSRALVELDGAPTERRFTSAKTGEEVVINGSGTRRTSYGLGTPVVPVYAVVPAEERDWALNAWKELTGVFNAD